MDRTRTRCSVEVGIDPQTGLPDQLLMTILIGRKNLKGTTISADRAFSDGVEHIVFNYSYQLDSSEPVESFQIPPQAKKLLR